MKEDIEFPKVERVGVCAIPEESDRQNLLESAGYQYARQTNNECFSCGKRIW